MKNAMLIGLILLAAGCASTRALRQSSPAPSGQSGSVSAPAAPASDAIAREVDQNFFDPITSSGP